MKAQYKHRSLVVAEQYFKNTKPWPDGVSFGTPSSLIRGMFHFVQLCTESIEQHKDWELVVDGDWIVTHPDGHRECLSPEEFNQKYAIASPEEVMAANEVGKKTGDYLSAY